MQPLGSELKRGVGLVFEHIISKKCNDEPHYKKHFHFRLARYIFETLNYEMRNVASDRVRKVLKPKTSRGGVHKDRFSNRGESQHLGFG